jgi:hypothetical protein
MPSFYQIDSNKLRKGDRIPTSRRSTDKIQLLTVQLLDYRATEKCLNEKPEENE